MDKQREEELVKIMETELEQTGDFFGYHQWDGLIENDEMTTEELEEMDSKYKVRIHFLPR